MDKQNAVFLDSLQQQSVNSAMAPSDEIISINLNMWLDAFSRWTYNDLNSLNQIYLWLQ